MALDIAVLVSVGRHPASARNRRAVLDARALELALNVPGANIHLIHAGDADEPALREYLGMGVERLSVLGVPAHADVLPVLVAHLKALRPALVLCGTAAEQGAGSGELPYRLAAALGMPIVPAVAGFELHGGRAQLAQALPRGRRRGVEAALPVLLSVDRAAPEPRQSAYARAQRGQIERIAVPAAPLWQPPGEEQPARKRPKRLKLISGSGAERMRAAQGAAASAGKGQLLVQPEPAAAAQAIYDYLLSEGILRG